MKLDSDQWTVLATDSPLLLSTVSVLNVLSYNAYNKGNAFHPITDHQVSPHAQATVSNRYSDTDNCNHGPFFSFFFLYTSDQIHKNHEDKCVTQSSVLGRPNFKNVGSILHAPKFWNIFWESLTCDFVLTGCEIMVNRCKCSLIPSLIMKVKCFIL